MTRNRALTVAAVGVLGFGLAAFMAGRAWAGGIPSTGALTYSGTLENAAGAALTGNHNLQVNFWSATSAGTNVCPQTTSTSIALDAGRFTYPLPDTCTAAVKASPNLWAEVLVDGASLGRTKIGAVPYAVEAGEASGATGALATQIAGLAQTNALPVVTAWTSYSPTVAASSDGTPIGGMQLSGEYRRVGDTLEGRIHAVVGASGITGSGQLAFSFPAAAPPDSTKLAGKTASQAVGTGHSYHAATGATYGGAVYLYTYLTALGMNFDGAGPAVTTTNPVAIGASDEYDLFFSYPVQGWTTTGP